MRTVPLKEVAEVNPRPSRSRGMDVSAPVSFLPMASVSEEGWIIDEQERSLGEVVKGYTAFAEGDVLVAKITPCMENGKAALVRKMRHRVGYGSTEFHVLRPGEDIDARFLFYLVWNPEFRAKAARNMTGTAGQKRVPASFLADYPVPLPPLAEQRRIAAILDKADAIRRKRRQAIGLVDDLLQSTFLEMFGDPVTNPRGWPVARLDAVSEIASGVTKGPNRSGRQTVSVPYMRVANVKDGRIDTRDVRLIDVSAADIDAYRLVAGDILLTEGGDPDKLGRGAVWNGMIDPCIHQNHVFRVRCDQSVLEPEYLSALVGSRYGKAYFFAAAKQTTGIASINKSQLRAFPVLVPPRHTQARFMSARRSFERLQTNLGNASSNADALFQTLAHRAFRGEL